MPDPLAIALIVMMVVLLMIALLVLLFEIGRGAVRFLRLRATAGPWNSAEPPGRLDYAADGVRASERFSVELIGLTKRTAKLAREINKHTRQISKRRIVSNPTKRQKQANKAAASIRRTAVFMKDREGLLKDLVEDVRRNYRGAIAISELNTDDGRKEAATFLTTLQDLYSTTVTTMGQLKKYRDSIQVLHDSNMSRSIRTATSDMLSAQDNLTKVIDSYNSGIGELVKEQKAKIKRAG